MTEIVGAIFNDIERPLTQISRSRDLKLTLGTVNAHIISNKTRT